MKRRAGLAMLGKGCETGPKSFNIPYRGGENSCLLKKLKNGNLLLTWSCGRGSCAVTTGAI